MPPFRGGLRGQPPVHAGASAVVGLPAGQRERGSEGDDLADLAGHRSDGNPRRRVYQRYSPLHTVDGPRTPGGSLARGLPVPSTAVYSRWDGVVDWRACRQQPGPRSENVAVRSSHLGMGHDPAVLWVVADRLAQPRDEWRPFQRPTRFGLGALFPAED